LAKAIGYRLDERQAAMIGRRKREAGSMPTTVYFATNRQVTNASDPVTGYPPIIVPPSSSDQVTFGTAFVDGIDIATNTQGTVSQIVNTNKGSFPPATLADLS